MRVVACDEGTCTGIVPSPWNPGTWICLAPMKDVRGSQHHEGDR